MRTKHSKKDMFQCNILVGATFLASLIALSNTACNSSLGFNHILLYPYIFSIILLVSYGAISNLEFTYSVDIVYAL